MFIFTMYASLSHLKFLKQMYVRKFFCVSLFHFFHLNSISPDANGRHVGVGNGDF